MHYLYYFFFSIFQISKFQQICTEQYYIVFLSSEPKIIIISTIGWNTAFSLTLPLLLTGADKLSKPVATQKWDRIKLVCTQPFNKVDKLIFFTYGTK